MPVKQLTFQLMVRRECFHMVGATLVRNEERDQMIPKLPSWFKPQVGTWFRMNAEADRLNQIQQRSEFIDYFFFPDLPYTVKHGND